MGVIFMKNIEKLKFKANYKCVGTHFGPLWVGGADLCFTQAHKFYAYLSYGEGQGLKISK